MASEYDKLVRDKIPDIIRENSEEPVVHVADDEEYTERLLDKLEEEVGEFRESRDVGELADVLEVVHAVRKDSGTSADELAEIRTEKADQRGRFDDRIVLDRVER